MKQFGKRAIVFMLCFVMACAPVTVLAQCSHRNTEWVTTRVVTCTDVGKRVKRCKSCKKVLKTTYLASKGHDYSKKVYGATCISPKSTVYTCKRCGHKYSTVGKPLGHQWGSWKLVVSTKFSKNKKYYHVCQRCGVKRTETEAFIKSGAKDY